MAKTSSHRVLKALVALTLLAAVAFGGWAWQRYQGFADTPIALAGSERMHRGGARRRLPGHPATSCARAGVDEGHDLEWKVLAQEMQVVSRLQVGDYAIRHGITPRELLAKLESGKVIQHRFTIVEGWNLRDLRAALAKDEVLLQQSRPTLDDAALMTALDRPGQHPEGRFLPETYHYTRGMTRPRPAAAAPRWRWTRRWPTPGRARADGMPLEDAGASC